MADEIPVVPPVEALAFFRRKGLTESFAWQDVEQEDHARAFTVAKSTGANILEDVRAALDAAIADGTTLATFQKDLRPLLEAKGWWGRKPMRDPLTGVVADVQLGSPRRLRTMFQVNMRSAYQAGRWERMQRNKAAFPYVRYMHSGSSRDARPQHVAWHGTIKRIDDGWWDTHYPPCGWGCKCTAQPVNDRMMARRGWEVTDRPPAFLPERYVNPRTGEVSEIEAGISPGFNFNIGKAYLQDLVAKPLSPPVPVALAIKGITVADLDAADREVLHGYTELDYKPVNILLRGADAYDEDTLEWRDDRAAAKLLPALDRTMAKVRLPAAVQVWRGIQPPFARELRDMPYKPGDLYVDQGYMSTTLEKAIPTDAFGEGEQAVVLKIFAPAGASGVDVTEVSGSRREKEILFARSTRMRVRRWDPARAIFELEIRLDDQDEPL